MRKYLFVPVAVLGLMFGLCGCVENDTKQQIRCIGKEYDFKTLSFKVDVDAKNERFTFEYKMKQENKRAVSFYFNFIITSTNVKIEKDEFEYRKSDDRNIEFDDFKTYSFDSSCTLYVYYKEANESVKQAVSTDNYSIETTGGTYIPEKVFNASSN